MNEEMTPAEKARNFTEMWSNKPWMIMGSASSLLANARAFLFGIKWATAFHEPGLDAFRRFLETFDRKLSSHLTGNDDGVSWYQTLLDRHDGDQNRAFQEFIQLLQEIAKREQVMSTNVSHDSSSKPLHQHTASHLQPD
jgi:hypothetical protein